MLSQKLKSLFVISLILVFHLGSVTWKTAFAAGATIRGKVVTATGLGLSGVDVLSHDGITFISTTSTSDGSFVLSNLAEGGHHLQASKANTNYAISHYWGFTVVSGSQYQNVNFTLRNGGGSVAGRVVNGNGNGISGAVVNAWEETAQGFDNGTWATTTTDSSGYYETSINYAPGPGLPTGKYTVKASKSGFPDSLIPHVSVTAGSKTSNINFTLTGGSGSITGHVTDRSTGSPIANATVYADSGTSQITAATGSSGDYQLSGLPAAYFNIVITKAGYATAHRNDVPSIEGVITSGIDFSLSNRIGQISGRVINASGQPLIGVTILAGSEQGSGFGSTTTNGNGDYYLNNLEPMDYLVHADAVGYYGVIKSATVVASQVTQNVNFILGTAAGGISGTVTKAGQPAGNAAVYINSSQGSQQQLYKQTLTDITGDYLVDNLPIGRYDVHISGVSGFTNQILFGINVNTQIITGVDFNLLNGDASVTGRVTNSSGEPISNAYIAFMQLSSPGTWAAVFSDNNGYYSITNLWSGVYHIFTSHLDYAVVEKNNHQIQEGMNYWNVTMGLPRSLTVEPNSIATMVEDNSGTSALVLVEVTSGENATWTATSNSSWLLLGTQGQTYQVTGITGEGLLLRFVPNAVPYGIHNTTVTLTSTDAVSTNVQVTMIKTNDIYRIFLPTAVR